MDKIIAGSVNQSITFAVKSVYAITEFRATYTRYTRGDGTSFTTATNALTALASIITAHTDNKGIFLSAVATDGAKYQVRVDYPDAAFAAGADEVICTIYDDSDEEVAHRIFALIPDEVAQYNGSIWVDTNNGTAGTKKGFNGLPDRPVDNIGDAITLSTATGIKRFHVAQRSGITLGATMTEYEFDGIDYFIDFANQELNKVVIRGAWVSGLATTNDDEVTLIDCILGIISLPGGTRCFNCKLTGLISLGNTSSTYYFDKCSSFNYSATTAVIDYDSKANIDVLITGFEGTIEIQKMGTAAGHTLEITGNGEFIENANCTSGSPKITGAWKLTGITDLTPDAYTNSGVNVTKINNEDTDGYNAALKLKALDIQNNAGNAITAKSTGANGHGAEIVGHGSGDGILVEGGSSGGVGIVVDSDGDANAVEFKAAAGGDGSGLYLQGGSGGSDINAAEIAAIQAKTDNLPHSVKKNTIIEKFKFVMFDATTGDPTAGFTVTATKKLDADAAWSAMTGTIRNLGFGAYDIDINAADTNGDTGIWLFTAPGAKVTFITIVTEEV